MPSKVFTKITWPQNGEELKDARKKQKELGYDEFSPFVRAAVIAFNTPFDRGER